MSVQSTYNVIIPLRHENDDSPYYALFNTLAGSIDVIDEKIAIALQSYKTTQNQLSGFIPISDLFAGSNIPARANPYPEAFHYLERRGYLFASREEEQQQSRLLYNAMMQFHRSAVQQPLVVIPSYNCDLKCPYCWQRLYHMDSPIMKEEVANHLFEVVSEFRDVETSGQTDLIIFGGEPLQDVPALRQRVIHLLDLGAHAGFSTKIISNGVGLGPNVPYLKGKVDVIQVTIDGPAEVHRKTRPLPRNQDSFTPMVEGVNRAIAAGIRINVRVNTSETNLYALPELADFADQQGWLDSGLVRFHLAPVKNHNPRKETKSEASLLDKVLDLVAQDKRMAIYDLTGFPGIKYFEGFKETGLFSLHRFFNCEAQINFFAFDLYGDVYACWDAAGLKHLAVGTFYPEVKIDPDKLGQWRDRSSLDIGGCQDCASSPHCGGGCQFLALEHNDTFLESNCDSMMEGYIQSIIANREWLIERAKAGDHAVGWVTAEGVKTAVNLPFGLVGKTNNATDLPLSCA